MQVHPPDTYAPPCSTPTRPGFHGRYQLLDVALDVYWNDPALGHEMHSVLDYFAISPWDLGPNTASAGAEEAIARSKPAPPARGRIFLSFEEGVPAIPAVAREVNECAPGVLLLRSGRRYFVRHHDSVATVDPEAAGIVIGMSQTDRSDEVRLRRAMCFFVWMGLPILLASLGYFVLHAAALVREGRGHLFVGRSGSGKSTVSYGLLRQGWNCVSDDVVFLQEGPENLEAFSVRRDFCMEPDAASLFPEIVRYRRPPITNEEKWRIDVTSLFPDRVASRCVPHVLLFPVISDERRSRLEPVTKQEAMVTLLHESGLFVALDAAVTPVHLRVLKRLLAQAPCFRILLGRDHREDPNLISSLLSPLYAPRE